MSIYTAESLRFDGTGLNATDKKLYSPTDGELQWFTHDLAGAHAFSVSHQGTRRVYLNTSGTSYFNGGNVGIGTTSPVAKFEVTDGSSSIALQEYSNGAAIFLDGVNGDFIGGDYFHILADGNSYLGLGGYGGGTTPLN